MASSINPFYYFEVWQGRSNILIGRQLSLEEYQSLIEQRYTLHSFTGRRATVAVISENSWIARNDKLKFAISFMEGKLVRTDVDLKNLTSTTATVNPPP